MSWVARDDEGADDGPNPDQGDDDEKEGKWDIGVGGVGAELEGQANRSQSDI